MLGLRYVIVGVALTVAVAKTPRAFAVETNTSARAGQATSAEARVLTITDSILQNHIDPPTRQEMLLAGVKALYRASDQPTPNGLSKRISELATTGRILAYLHTIHTEFKQLPSCTEVLINGMFDAVPGGGGLINAGEAKVQAQLAANRYVGIGIALSMSKAELPIISTVFYNGPAWKTGVKTDDVILEIDGEPTAKNELADAVKRLRGEAGTDVTVLVQQPDSKPRELKITRSVTFIPTIEGYRKVSDGQWQYTIDSAHDIALLRIKRIGPSTLHELRKVEASLRTKEIRGIVLDLRVGGGMLHDTVMLADQLLDGGTIGYVRTLEEVTKHEARPGCLFQNTPMAVLIAEYSNADRVFLTAALQDQQRAVVIGEPTFGETYVNSHVPTPGGDQFRLAIGVMQRADGTTLLRPKLNRWTLNVVVPVENKANKKVHNKPPGIIPDHIVRYAGKQRSAAEQEQISDPMLATAIEILHNTAQAEVGTKKNSVPG